jgi:hypothetical protein
MPTPNIPALLELVAQLIEWSEEAGARVDHARLWRRHDAPSRGFTNKPRSRLMACRVSAVLRSTRGLRRSMRRCCQTSCAPWRGRWRPVRGGSGPHCTSIDVSRQKDASVAERGRPRASSRRRCGSSSARRRPPTSRTPSADSSSCWKFTSHVSRSAGMTWCARSSIWWMWSGRSFHRSPVSSSVGSSRTDSLSRSTSDWWSRCAGHGHDGSIPYGSGAGRS